MDKYKKSLILLETVDSTNDWARANLSSFCRNSFTIVQALEQSCGKGISGAWHSPADVGIYSSYVTFLLSSKDAAFATHIAAASILHMLDEMGICADIKWPNDIVICHKKIGGILCETVPYNEKTAIILGIGLNINTSQREIDTIDRPATSLYLEYGSTYCCAHISDLLSNHLIANFDRYLQWGFAPFHSFLQNRLAYLRKFIQVHTPSKLVTGQLLGMSMDGALQLQLPNKETISIYSGRVVITSPEQL